MAQAAPAAGPSTTGRREDAQNREVRPSHQVFKGDSFETLIAGT